MNSLKPVGARLLVKPIKILPKTSGILLPDSVMQKETKGTIVAKGDKVKEELSIGDEVHFTEFSGMEVKLKDGKFILIREMEILGKTT